MIGAVFIGTVGSLTLELSGTSKNFPFNVWNLSILPIPLLRFKKEYIHILNKLMENLPSYNRFVQ